MRFPTLRRFQKVSVIQWIKKLLSPALRRKLKFWLDQLNNLPDDYEPGLSADSHGKLINHFNTDIEQLTQSFESLFHQLGGNLLNEICKFIPPSHSLIALGNLNAKTR